MNVASAFSNYFMPVQKKTLNVVEVVELTLDIFNENIISEKNHLIISKIDRTQLVRLSLTCKKRDSIYSRISELKQIKWLSKTI
jgi:hypothetical protein